MQSESAIGAELETGPRVAAAARADGVGRIVRAGLPLAAAMLLIVALAWPMLFTLAEFASDWSKHLWFLWKESLEIRENRAPSFFLNYSRGVFYPEFAFYGGTLYALLGALSLALGDAPMETYVLAYLLGFAAAYGGWYWLGRMAGLGRWWAQAPGVVFVTAAYYLTLIYARGDQPEFLAVSSMPLLIASGLSVLRADRLRFWPALALALSAVVFCGSHILTLIWGSTLLALASALVLAGIPQARRRVSRRGLLRLACLLVPALLLSAWYLLPAVAYQRATHVSHEYLNWRLMLIYTMPLVAARVLFTLSRASASTPGADFALSLPILAIAWSLVAIPLCLRRGLREAWVRLLLICAAMTILATILMTHSELVLALPRPYATLQFAYRLESYVALCLSATVLAGLRLLRRDSGRPRLWTWAVVPVALVGIVGALQQVDAISRSGDRGSAIAWTGGVARDQETLPDYLDLALPLMIDRHGHPPEVNFPEAAVRDDSAVAIVHLAPRELVYSNIAAGPEFVHVSGARIVGIDRHGGDVLQIGPSAAGRRAGSSVAGDAASRPAWTERISVSPADGLPIVAGRLISLAALAFLLGLFGWLGVSGLRRRGAARRAG